MNTNHYPNLLIISNNPLSNVDANGRTLQNFLIGWPREKIAQFYIQNGRPDDSVCSRFYRITDSQAIRALLHKKPPFGGPIQAGDADKAISNTLRQRYGRSAVTKMFREMVWNIRFWWDDSLTQWIEDFRPELLLLQTSDSGFMLRLARDLAKKYNIPLVMYNSEVYYFKDYNYFRTKGFSNWVYPLFHRYFRKEMQKTLPYAHKTVYCCREIQQLYDEEFGLPSDAIYTVTEVNAQTYTPREDSFRVSYLGSLGVGRHEVLVEIANILHQIDPRYVVDVYGRIPTDEVQAAFDHCPGIAYQGFVSYDEVIKIIGQSDLLIHGENMSEYHRKDLEHAFSTKIADSLASGRCFLLYAPEESTCYRYLRRHEAAYVAHDPQSLKDALQLLIQDPQARLRYLERAQKLVEENHRPATNAKRFQNILEEAYSSQSRK